MLAKRRDLQKHLPGRFRSSFNSHVADGIELHGTSITLIDNTVKNNSGGSVVWTESSIIANWDLHRQHSNGHSGIEIAHSSSTFPANEMGDVESAIDRQRRSGASWSDTSNT